MSQKTIEPMRGAGDRRPNGEGRAAPPETGSGLVSRLKAYALDNPHDLGHLVDELLRTPPATGELSDLITWIARERRVLVRPQDLARLCELDGDALGPLYRELSRSRDGQVLAVLGFIMGGMGGRDPEKLFEMMLQKRIAGIPLLGAVRTAGMAGRRIPDKIASIVLRYAGSKDRYTRNMAIRVAIEQLHGSKETVGRMLRLARSDDETRVWMAQCVSSSRMDPEAAFRLLKECSKIKDGRYLDAVASHVGYMAAMFPVECLDILKAWVKRFSPAVKGHRICWIAEQIGASKKADFEKIEGLFLGWINTECRKNKSKNRAAYRFLEFSLPDLIHDVYKCRQHEFLSLVKKIDYKNKNKKDVIVRIIETFFSESYERIKGPISDECGDLLADIAIHHGLDRTFRADLPSPTMETLALVQNIRLNKKIVDPVQAKKNLGEFPNMARFLTRTKIHNLIDTDTNHPLVRLLDKSKVTRKTFKKFEKMIGEASGGYRDRLIRELVGRHYPKILLQDLDRILGGIKPEGKAEIRRMMLNEGFYVASTQLTIYERFKKRNYRPQLEPKLDKNVKKSKRADLCVKIRNTDCYFELYQPKSPQHHELEYIRRAHKTDTRKIKEKIRKKINSQLEAAAHLDSPVILVLDNQHLSVSDIDVRDLLEGSLQLECQISRNGISEVSHPTRANDSFNREIEHGKVMSAVILLRSTIDDKTLEVKLQGDIYKNPGSRFPLSREIIQDLKDVLFNDAGKV